MIPSLRPFLKTTLPTILTTHVIDPLDSLHRYEEKSRSLEGRPKPWIPPAPKGFEGGYYVLRNTSEYYLYEDRLQFKSGMGGFLYQKDTIPLMEVNEQAMNKVESPAEVRERAKNERLTKIRERNKLGLLLAPSALCASSSFWHSFRSVQVALLQLSVLLQAGFVAPVMLRMLKGKNDIEAFTHAIEKQGIALSRWAVTQTKRL